MFQAQQQQLLDDTVICCLQELLEEPVIAADGYTYEQHAFQEWLKQHTNSPVTGQPLQNAAMLSKFAIMAVLEGYCLVPEDHK